jgi:hypothetical protein
MFAAGAFDAGSVYSELMGIFDLNQKRQIYLSIVLI